MATPQDAHDFEEKIVGYDLPSEPQWVQETVFCYRPPIIWYTCKKCGFNFGGRNGMYSLLLFSGALTQCPDPNAVGSMEGLPVIDNGDPHE